MKAIGPGSELLPREAMSPTVQMACVWGIPVGILLVTVGLWPLAGYIPPPPADLSADQLAAFYRGNTTQIRLGIYLTLIGFLFWGPMVAVTTRQMLRIRRADKTLAYAQLAGGSVGWLFTFAPFLILGITAFRPDRPATETQSLHDLGWLMFVVPFVPFVIQNLAIALATFADDSAPEQAVFPRWFGYLQIWVALLFLPAGLALFFKTGPFSYQGLICFWLPLTAFFVWAIAMTWALRRAVRQEAAAHVAGAGNEPTASLV